MGERMQISSAVVEISIGKLMDKAGDCLDRAKSGHALAVDQHELAETQHQSADKVDAHADRLEKLGHALIDDALELKVKWNFPPRAPRILCPAAPQALR